MPDEKKDCSFCALERVEWSRVPECTWLSFVGLFRDIFDRKLDVITAFTLNDRIVYILGVVVVITLLRLL